MDALLAKLSNQQALLATQNTAISSRQDEGSQLLSRQNGGDRPKEESPTSASSALLTPSSDSFGHSTAPNETEDTLRLEAAEMARLKKELDVARDQIARQKQQLDQSRVIKHTLEQAMGPASDAALSPAIDQSNAPMNLPVNTRPGWAANEDSRSDGSDFNTGPNIWGSRSGFGNNPHSDTNWGQPGGRTYNQRAMGNALPQLMMSQQQPIPQRNYSVPISPVSVGSGRGMNDFSRVDGYNSNRGSYGHLNAQNRNGSVFQQRGNGFDMYAGGANSLDNMNLGGMNPGSAYQSLGVYPYQPQPIGTPLSPTAAEFRAGQASANPWNAAVGIMFVFGFYSADLSAASSLARPNLCLAHGTTQLSSSPRP